MTDVINKNKLLDAFDGYNLSNINARWFAWFDLQSRVTKGEFDEPNCSNQESKIWVKRRYRIVKKIFGSSINYDVELFYSYIKLNGSIAGWCLVGSYRDFNSAKSFLSEIEAGYRSPSGELVESKEEILYECEI